MGSGGLIQPRLCFPARSRSEAAPSGPSPASGWQCLHLARTMRSCHKLRASGLGRPWPLWVPQEAAPEPQ